MEVTDEQINKRIAEFMGWKPWKENANYLVDPNHDFYRSLSKNMPYCKSLDSLIPVVAKKMKTNRTLIEHIISQWLLENAFDMNPRALSLAIFNVLEKR